MSGLRKIRIVNTSPFGSPRMADVFDGETGEKLTNVYRIELLATPDQFLVRLDLACELEFEGPAEVRRLRIKADGTTEEIAEHEEHA